MRIRKFNESLDLEKIEDYLFVFLKKDPIYVETEKDWMYCQYDIDDFNLDNYNSQKVENYLNGPRFTNTKKFYCFDYEYFYLLIVSEDFYNKNLDILTTNLVWVKHQLVKDLEKSFGNLSVNSIFDHMKNAKMVDGLKNGCSLIKDINAYSGMEFWPIGQTDCPIVPRNDVELQHFLYKYAI